MPHRNLAIDAFKYVLDKNQPGQIQTICEKDFRKSRQSRISLHGSSAGINLLLRCSNNTKCSFSSHTVHGDSRCCVETSIYPMGLLNGNFNLGSLGMTIGPVQGR